MTIVICNRYTLAFRKSIFVRERFRQIRNTAECFGGYVIRTWANTTRKRINKSKSFYRGKHECS